MKHRLLSTFVTLMLLLIPFAVHGQPPMGTTVNFVLYSSVGAITNSGIPHLTHLTGHVGTNIGSSTGFGNVDGQMHDGDGVSAACGTDLLTLYGDLTTRTVTFTPGSPNLGNGDTLVAGVYQYPLMTAANLNQQLVLDAQNNTNALFIIKIDGAFSTAPSSKVVLANGALACNVFWVVEGAINMATQTTMRGTMIANNAAISMGVQDTLEGRALAINGQITTNAVLAYKPIGCGSVFLTGPTAPPLASAAAFGVFSGIGSVTATPITYVVGDVGSNSMSPTGFDPLNVTGTIHPNPNVITGACASDLTIAYNYLNALANDIELLSPAIFGYDLVLTPHVYHLGAATTLTGNVILNAQGNPNAVFVIKIDGAFGSDPLAPCRVVLINGTQAKNVYWKVDGATHIYDNSLFNGNIIGAGAITIDPGDTINGRVLTIGGAVAINGSYVTNAPLACVASPITGTFTLCESAFTTLSNIDTGGVWVSSHPLIASIDSFTGVVTGVSAGNSTITFTSGLACEATASMTINASPANITGADSVCLGANTTYSNTIGGGTWSSSNTIIATVGSISGIVTGNAQGTADITYALSGGCNVVKTITVYTAPALDPITGTFTLCPAGTSQLSNTIAGGVWTSSNTIVATIDPSTGIVTGLVIGNTTISYTVTNACGTSVVNENIIVNAVPNAGTISGTTTLCVGNTTTLSNSVLNGTWSSSDITVASIDATSGLVTAVDTGMAIITYTITNSCGTAESTISMNVNPLPAVGSISGTMTICVGDTTTVYNTSTDGLWSSSNTSIATIDSLTGMVTGISSGNTTIEYTVVNSCGTAVATSVMSVDPLPDAGTILGIFALCPEDTTTFSNLATGGIWSSANTSVATIDSVSGFVTAIVTGNSVISYSVTNNCGTDVTTITLTVNPLPNAGTLTGPSEVCVGSSITLTPSASGGVWSNSNTHTTVVSGIVTGVSPGVDTINYAVTNSCGTATTAMIITIYDTPATPVITTQSPSAVCTGTMYQNFGTSIPPATYTVYNWTAVNATVWAQGLNSQYALINFDATGTAFVTLHSTIPATGCTSQSTVVINVNNTTAHTDYVSYFSNHFVATPNNRNSYQWGYDDRSSLDSTLLFGEINQDYVNANPDFANKYYWVITNPGACQQKTYYAAPTAADDVMDAQFINLYPNPAQHTVNVEMTNMNQGNITLEVINLMGQTMMTIAAKQNKVAIDIAKLPAGAYMVASYLDGIRINSTRFIKN
jgi:uncharacterized protein YjdB